MMPAGDEWRALAACAGMDTRAFFPDPQNRGPGSKARMAILAADALAACARCPVRSDCLADAIASGDCHGVRGGLLPNDLAARLGGLRSDGQPRRTWTACQLDGCGRILTPQQRARRMKFCGPDHTRQARAAGQKAHDEQIAAVWGVKA